MRNFLFIAAVSMAAACADQTRPIEPDAGSDCGSAVDSDDPPDMSEASASWLVAGAMCARSSACGMDLGSAADCGGIAHDYLCSPNFEDGDCSTGIVVSAALVEECTTALATAPCDLSQMPDACLHAVGAGTWRQ